MENFKKRVVRGAYWSVVRSAAVPFIEIGRLTVLARLLPVHIFGYMAVIEMVNNIAGGFIRGLPQGVVVKKENSADHLSALFTFILMCTLLLVVVLFAVAPYIVSWFQMPEIVWPFRAGLGFLLFGSSVRPLLRKLLQKELNIKVITIGRIIASVFGAVGAVGLVLWGLEIWALVLGYLISTAVDTLFLFVYYLKRGSTFFRFYMNIRYIQWYIRFGVPRGIDQLFSMLTGNVDKILVALFLPFTSVGFYQVAKKISQKINRISPIIGSISLAAFSAVDDKKRLANILEKTMVLLGGMLSPVLIGFSAIAPVAVPFLLGQKWLPAVPIVQILCVYVLLTALERPLKNMVLSYGQSLTVMIWNIANVVVTSGAILLVLLWSGTLMGVAVALLLSRILVGVGYGLYVLTRHFNLKYVVSLVGSMLRTILCAVMMGAGVWLMTYTAVDRVHPVVQLIIYIVTGGLGYLVLTYLLSPFFLYNLLDISPAFVQKNPLGIFFMKRLRHVKSA